MVESPFCFYHSFLAEIHISDSSIWDDWVGGVFFDGVGRSHLWPCHSLALGNRLDRVLRHPTQLYEILFLFVLFWVLQLRSRYKSDSGDLFQFFTIGYLSFRFLVDFIKPDFHPLLGLSAIQIACLLGLGYYWRSFLDFARVKSQK